MFLALFPFSEVVYGIAIFLAWIYIALGFLGNNEVAKEAVLSFNGSQVHEKVIPISDNAWLDERTCQWLSHVNNYNIAYIATPALKLAYFVVNKITYCKQANDFCSYNSINQLPNRAPPFI